MSIEIVFQIVEAIAVVIGVAFAIVQVRQYRREQHRESAVELLHSFQTPQFAKALKIVYNLPDGLSKEEIESTVGDDFHLVYALMTTWESLGILVYRGEIDLEMVDDFFLAAQSRFPGQSSRGTSWASGRCWTETPLRNGFNG